MIGPSPTLEERLLHGYREQLSRYDRAAEILEEGEKGRMGEGEKGRQGEKENEGEVSPLLPFSPSPLLLNWAHALHATLQEAAAVDAAMAQDIAAWRALGQTPTGPLKEILERLAQRIRSLSASIDRQVRETQASQMGMVAEIDEFIQKRRMLQAYVKQ